MSQSVLKKLFRRSLMIGLIVGTLLNVINQYDALLGELPLNVWKLSLTYCVPFCVSMVSGYMTIKEVSKPEP